MAKPKNLEKLVLSVVSTIVAVVAWILVIAGSFVPRWARPLNTNRTDGNTTFSLWGREVCYGVICNTKYREEHSEVKTWWMDEHGQKHVKVTQSVQKVPITTCMVANYCNITWYEDVDFTEIPSLLFVARSFIIPSFCAGFICIVLYVLKIIVIVIRPSWRRIHIKAAYLTFSAIAGVSAGIAVIIYVAMLEDGAYELLWAPALPGVGGCLFICISVGGYLSWRTYTTEIEHEDRADFQERSSSLHEFSNSGKPHRKPAPRGGGHKRGYPAPKQSKKSDGL